MVIVQNNGLLRSNREAASVMPPDNSEKLQRRWRRKELAEHWRVSERTVDRLRKEGKLGEPEYVGKMPSWSDEQRKAVQRPVPFQIAESKEKDSQESHGSHE